MFHPEMSRALADQHIRDLHRLAAQHRALDAPPSPVGQHWAVLAVRLHLRRAAATPLRPPPSRRPGRARSPRRHADPQAGSAPARQPMGCIA